MVAFHSKPTRKEGYHAFPFLIHACKETMCSYKACANFQTFTYLYIVEMSKTVSGRFVLKLA